MVIDPSKIILAEVCGYQSRWICFKLYCAITLVPIKAEEKYLMPHIKNLHTIWFELKVLRGIVIGIFVQESPGTLASLGNSYSISCGNR